MPSRRLSLQLLGAVASLGVVIALSFGAVSAWRGYRADQLEQQAHRALQQGNFPAAHKAAHRLYQLRPQSPEARRILAESLRMLGETEQAYQHYQALVNASAESNSPTVQDHVALGEILIHKNEPTLAEQQFQLALELDPASAVARVNLVHLLSLECRTYDAIEQRHAMLQYDCWEREDLLYLAKPQDLMLVTDLLEQFLARQPDHPDLLLARARHARTSNDHAEALKWVERILDVAPDSVEAHADRGLLLVDQSVDATTLAGWYHDLPSDALQHPDIWFVQGLWARRLGQTQAAVRCFCEALHRDPNHRSATHQVSLALAALNEPQAASTFSQRVTNLDQLVRIADQLFNTPQDANQWALGAETLEQLGRWTEAIAWYTVVAQLEPAADVEPEIKRLQQQLAGSDQAMVVESQHPLTNLAWRQYPLPSFPSNTARVKPSPRRESAERAPDASTPVFAEVSEKLGLRFSLIGADEPLHRDRHMPDLFGAGLGTLDFDLDGWPDLYAPQIARGTGDRGSGASPREDARNSDRLFRNVLGQQFTDVTGPTHLGDARYSQGVAVGDFNNDGFPDMLLANIGQNRLYLNNGDGTFDDVAIEAGLEGTAWTSSAAIADLNGDFLPDIYEVNYLSGQEVYRVICEGGIADAGACAPARFPAAQDQFYLNLGDGRFERQTQTSGILSDHGKGWGLIVADFAGTGRLSVFVANDTTANHYFVNQAAVGDPPQFTDQAALRGLAFDRNGLTQACMGIATSYLNADRQLDLYVTNFEDEANTLYLSREGGLYEDFTRSLGLYKPTLPVLGFGTEFLDADLDGDDDLIVVNGHIYNSPAGFQMRPQWFTNEGRFVERSAEDVGPYFEKPRLARALVRWDFDRDGRQDAAVSHLDAPLAVLHNATAAPGHSLSLQLRGTQCDRDAIGTIVTVTTPDGENQIRQLVAGDGYQCSNERHLVFGLGQHATATSITIRWPDGREQHLDQLAADHEYLVRQGDPPYPLEHRPDPTFTP